MRVDPNGTFGDDALLYATCETCDDNLRVFLQIHGKTVAYDRSPTLVEYPLGHSATVEPAFEFHERDGVLLGRPHRASPYLNGEMNWTKLPE